MVRSSVKLPTPYRVAAGLIYLSVGSLVGLLLAPLVVVSLVLRAVSWLPLVGLPRALSLCVRGGSALARWAGRAPADRPPRSSPLSEALREVPAKMAALRDGFSFSLPMLRAVADLERLLAHSVAVDRPGPGEPPHPASAQREEQRESSEANWDDIGYLGLLLLGTVWLIPLAALAIPVVSFLVALPVGPTEQLAFGPGNTILVDGPGTRILVALGSVVTFAVLTTLLFDGPAARPYGPPHPQPDRRGRGAAPGGGRGTPAHRRTPGQRRRLPASGTRSARRRAGPAGDAPDDALLCEKAPQR